MRKSDNTNKAVFGFVTFPDSRQQLRSLMPSLSSLPVSLKDPSTLFYLSNAVERSVIVSYWIVNFLSVPLWWYNKHSTPLTATISDLLSCPAASHYFGRRLC
jgi:hypothetical protein